MDRQRPYFRQFVTSDQVTTWFDGVESADRAIVADSGFAGIMSGLVASPHSTGADYTVDVAGPGWGYDTQGERIYVGSTQNVDLSTDYLGASTNVSGLGNSKVLSLFIEFARDNTTPVTDGNGAMVEYNELESFAWVVVQGSEAATGTQTPPAHISNALLVCNVTLAYNSSLPQQITSGMIDMTSSGARDDLVVVAGTPLAIRRGTYLAAISDIVAKVNEVAVGTGISYAGGPNWAGGTSPTNPATTVSGQLTKILTDLSAETAGASGADRIGVAALVGVSSTIVAGTLFAALTSLKSASSIDVAALGAWADATTNPAATLQAGVARVVSDLASTSTSGRGTGAAKVGLAAHGNFTSTTVDGQLRELDGTTLGSDGAKHVGAASGGTNNFTGTTVRAQLDETTRSAALASQTGTTGEELVGGKALTGTSLFTASPLAAGTLEARLQAIINAAAPANDCQVYSTAGSFTWNKPSWATSTSTVEVLIVAAGGGGGGGAYESLGTNSSGGAAGAGGGMTRRRFPASAVTSSVSVTVGTGGTGGSGGTVGSGGVGGTGNAGGASQFGSYLLADGGNGGVGGSNAGTSGPTGGFGEFSGGSGAGSVAGSAGANGSTTSALGGAGGGGGGGMNNTNAALGGGAGGSPGTSGLSGGTGGIGGNVGTGGAGGVGGAGTNSTMGPGTGGGGGGAGAGGPGGNGGKGGTGCGGGGGGATSTGFVAGNGGNGGDGLVVVITNP